MSIYKMVGSKRRRGFTLVELAVVVVIIGVLAAFGVPRFLQAVERSKASEAFAYLAAVRSAQERYHAREGTYADAISKLDLVMASPKYFGTPTTITAGTTGDLENSWTLTLTRVGASAGFGPYTVTFTDSGYDGSVTSPAIGEHPEINPMASLAGGGTTGGTTTGGTTGG